MTQSVRQRLDSIDLLRGVIIVVMALDHIRDYVHYPVQPTDLATTTGPLFVTRWVTHFCAPVFMLLAGTGAYLGLANGKTKGQLSWFLVTRGVWLVFLEVTVIRCFGWSFNFDYHLVLLIVIWALGAAMIVLAAMIWLPHVAVLALCVVGIIGHNALDDFRPSSWLWTILHAPGTLHIGDDVVVGVGYVLVPWVFVMGLGYAIGPVMRWAPERRRKVVVGTGLAMIAAFIVLRAIDRYGDPAPWTYQPSAAFTLFSLLNCTKYPPSLCYLLMTLGPAFVALALFEQWRGRIANIFLMFGRVPLFFYLLHLPVLHFVAVGLALIRYGHAGFLFENASDGDGFFTAPPGYGYPLWVVYLVWIGVVAVLYVPCRWFAEYKRTHRAAWLSYL
jgi:uncharacterized membrane protein